MQPPNFHRTNKDEEQKIQESSDKLREIALKQAFQKSTNETIDNQDVPSIPKLFRAFWEKERQESAPSPKCLPTITRVEMLILITMLAEWMVLESNETIPSEEAYIPKLKAHGLIDTEGFLSKRGVAYVNMLVNTPFPEEVVSYVDPREMEKR